MGATASCFVGARPEESVIVSDFSGSHGWTIPKGVPLGASDQSSCVDDCVESTASSYEEPESDLSVEIPGGGIVKERPSIMDSLPDDVLMKVLCAVGSSAEQPSDIVAPTMTCRRWRGMAREKEVLRKASRKGVSIRARQWGVGSFGFLQRLCDAGCLEACFMLGMILFYCIPGARMEGGRLLMRTAKGGHAAALHATSILSFNGSGAGKDFRDVRMGVALAARAAALGHVDAMRELGHCLLDGFGVKKDVMEGWKMLLGAQLVELEQSSMGVKAGHRREKEEEEDGEDPAMVDEEEVSVSDGRKRKRPLGSVASRVKRVHGRESEASHGNSGALSAQTQQNALHLLLSSSSISVHSNRDGEEEGGRSRALANALPRVRSIMKQISAMDAAKLKEMEPVLAGLRTSFLPASPHPANLFLLEWFSKGGKGEGSLAKGHGVCGRASCGRPETRALEFWRCSTCWSACYCSRSCQLQDWQDRHSCECIARPQQERRDA